MSNTTNHRDDLILRKLCCLSKRYGGGWFYQKHAAIAELARSSVSTVQRSLKRLIAAKRIEVRQRWLVMEHGGSMQLCNEYRVLDRCLWCPYDRSVTEGDQRVSPVYLNDKHSKMSNRWSRLRMLMQPAGDSAPTPALLRSLEKRWGSEKRE